MTNTRGMKIFCGNASEKLASEIANELGLSLGLSEVTRFSDGEIKDILEKVLKR